MEVKRAEYSRRPTGLEAGYTPKTKSNVFNIWSVNSITSSSLMLTSSN